MNKPPPHNLEAEQSVLGAVLLRPQTLDEVAGIINAGDFYRTGHGHIYRAMLDLRSRGEPVDLPTVTVRLTDWGKLVEVGGPVFLAELSEHVGTAANAAYYAKVVHEKAILRQYQQLAQELLRESGKAGTSLEDLQTFLESRVHDLSRNGNSSKGLDLAPTILQVNKFKSLDIPERKSLIKPFLRELSIGMASADRGTGKTMLALSFCDAISRGTGFGPWEVGAPTNCLYIDGEMVAHDIIERLGYFPQDRPAQFYILSDHYATLMGFPGTNFLDPSWRTAIKDFCLSHDVRFVVFDNLASLAAGVDENSATEWAPLAKYFLELRFAGIASLLLHHTGKSGTQRGTHAREDALDYSIMLERPKDYEPDQGASFILKFTKARVRQGDAHLIAPISLKLDRDPAGHYIWTWQPTRKANQEEVIELLVQGLKQQEIAAATGISRSMVAKIKARAIKEGKLDVR
jgi:RecA-family ATPase